MTTTIFRKRHKKPAVMASDTRVSYLNSNGKIAKWDDVDEFLKCVDIGGVLYGFAGTNIIFAEFLKEYDLIINRSDFWLDSLVEFAKHIGVQFYIMRYDGSLQLFAYSRADPGSDQPEIKRTSRDQAVNSKTFAIGSGRFSKMYKENKGKGGAQLPIRRIVGANLKAIARCNLKDVVKKAKNATLNDKESEKIAFACYEEGGDLPTGGKINMTTKQSDIQMERELVGEQVKLLEGLEDAASSNDLRCASPFDAAEEAARLNSMGQVVCSDYTPEQTDEFIALQQKLAKSVGRYF